MAGWYRRLERADEAARHDKGFVLSCVCREGLALKLAPDELRADPDVVAAAVEQNGLALRHAAKELRGQRDLVLGVVQRCGLALAFAPLALRRDRPLVLAAVRSDGLALEHAARELRGDRAVVMAAVEQTGEALQHARSALRDARDVVLAAVRRAGGALEFASPELRKDAEVCCAACRNDPAALRLVEDPELEQKARVAMMQGMREHLVRETEEIKKQALAEKTVRDASSQALLSSQLKLKAPKRDRRQQKDSKQSGVFQEKTAEWVEKTAMGGQLYRMIEGWRDENIPKIIQKGTLDLGDPWQRKFEKRRPAPPAPAAPPAQVMAPTGATQTQQRMVMSLVRREVYSGPEPEIVKSHIYDMVQKMTGSDELDMDTPLMESGVDSLMSVDLRTQLQETFKIPLSSTLMFNYPTMGGLTDYLVDELTQQKVPGWGKVSFEEVMEEVAISEQVPVMAAQAAPEPAAPAASAVQKAYQPPDADLVQQAVAALVQNLTGSDDIDGDTPLMESGIDSLASVDLRTSLQQEFTLDLPSTVMFNYPTMTGLTGYLVEQMETQQITWGPK